MALARGCCHGMMAFWCYGCKYNHRWEAFIWDVVHRSVCKDLSKVLQVLEQNAYISFRAAAANRSGRIVVGFTLKC